LRAASSPAVLDPSLDSTSATSLKVRYQWGFRSSWPISGTLPPGRYVSADVGHSDRYLSLTLSRNAFSVG